MHVCMLGEHESSDELRGQIKSTKKAKVTAEGRIKVNTAQIAFRKGRASRAHRQAGGVGIWRGGGGERGTLCV